MKIATTKIIIVKGREQLALPCSKTDFRHCSIWLLASLSLGHLHLLVTTLSSSMPLNWHSLSSSGCLSRFSNGSGGSLPLISLIISLCSIQTPLLVLSLLISLLHFHLCWLIPSFVQFSQMSQVLITWS